MNQPPVNAQVGITRIWPFVLGLALAGSLLLTGSLWWNVQRLNLTALEVARTHARTALEKDIIYRRWAAIHGGLYAPVSVQTPPNPLLSDIVDRDFTTPSGRKMTLINPAYMTRQVNELSARIGQVQGHITSLKPLRTANKPDPWEHLALLAIEKDKCEVSGVEMMGGQPYMRVIQPMKTELGCLKCHAKQGYKEGDVRGGVSVSVPMAPLLELNKADKYNLLKSYIVLWLVGLLALGMGARHVRRRISERDQAEAAREKVISELEEALTQVRTLRGLLPVCSQCKKIRDKEGNWQAMENYIQARSEADFTHSLCPTCAGELYPDLYDGGKKPPEK